MEVKIKTNSKEVIKELIDVQKTVVTTNSLITSTNAQSEKSFESLKNQLSSVNRRALATSSKKPKQMGTVTLVSWFGENFSACIKSSPLIFYI